MSTHARPARFIAFAGAILACAISGQAQQPPEEVTAIVGASVIDGNGGPPIVDATVVVRGTRIAAVGPRASTSVPPGARRIEAAGKYVTPGFIDTNVHLSLYGGTPGDRYETLARYQPRVDEITLEAAQLHLKHGITTVRDSYGQLRSLTRVRDKIAKGETVGSRMLVAGNIVGWGGPFSVSFSVVRDQGLTLFQEQLNDELAQGAGEELMDMTPAELRVAINTYLDKGPDFIKYGGTSHFSNPTFIGFSPEAQKVIVEEAHKRRRVAETHSTSIEGLRLSIEAGIDLIQHPEVMTPREMPDDLARLIAERKIICSVLSNTVTGVAWKRHLESVAETERRRARAAKDGAADQRTKTLAEQRLDRRELGVDNATRRANLQKLIRAGAVITIGTDNYWAAAPEFARTPKPPQQEHGLGSLIAIEGLVELGMTPAQAIVAATKHGALAAKALEQFGTLDTGKVADLLILDADPLANIGNIRKLHLVMKEGRIVDTNRLPEQPVFSPKPKTTPTSQE
jgi:imidazolonepropionase-like amidohydrolase